MAEWIDRQVLLEMFRTKVCSVVCELGGCDAPCDEMQCIMDARTIELKRGEWIEYKDEFTHCHQCSVCGGDAMGEGDENGMFFEVLTDICPHCGADMREGKR